MAGSISFLVEKSICLCIIDWPILQGVLSPHSDLTLIVWSLETSYSHYLTPTPACF